MQFTQYLNEQDITYDDYCVAVDYTFGINENVWQEIKHKAAGVMTKMLERVRDDLLQIGTDFQIGMGEIIDALKNKQIFKLFKELGWSFHKLVMAIDKFTALVRDGLLHTFKKLHKTGAFQKIASGAAKIDDFFDEHPILAKMTGPVVAGLLFWIWLNMTFIGNMDYDMDFSNMAKALAGNFSVTELFASPEGLMLSTLFATGSIISAPWLGARAYNIALALVYTGLKHAKGKDVHHAVITKMRSKIKTV